MCSKSRVGFEQNQKRGGPNTERYSVDCTRQGRLDGTLENCTQPRFLQADSANAEHVTP